MVYNFFHFNKITFLPMVCNDPFTFVFYFSCEYLCCYFDTQQWC